MPLKLMIDSGAFSVWSKGKTIDLDEYIRYCRSKPELSVVVNLDVIPPKGVRLTEEVKDEVAKKGWENYMKMIRVLDMEKVVPVYHRGDSQKWLEKYLDFGSPYIGLSPRFDGSAMDRRLKFVADCKKIVCGSDGKPLVKTHGFAVTNQTMMTMFPWYSVDSASWTQVAAWGGILVPKLRGGTWDFKSRPYRVFCSVVAMKRQESEHHLLAMKEQRPAFYENVVKWLDHCGVGIGEHKVVPAAGKKPKKVVEKWADRKKTKILQVIVPGVCNSDQVRRWINAVFFHHCNDALDIENLYLAGNGPCCQVEEQIRYRLRSFVEGPLATNWIYDRLGSYKSPMKFPFHEPLNFSFSKRTKKNESAPRITAS